MSETTYYLRIKGKVMGPLTLDKLQSLQERGRLLPDHELSTDRRQWSPAAQIVELFGDAPQAEQVAATVGDTEAAVAGDVMWFYLSDGERTGPASFAKLQQLVRSGKIQRDHLVWNADLDDWQPAQSIPGLCDSDGSSRRGKASRAAAVDIDRRSVPAALLEIVKSVVTADDLDAACRLLIQIGGYALILAMLAGPAYMIISAVKNDSVQGAVIGFTAVVGVWVLKFVGETLCLASHRLVQASPNRMSSTSFMHATAASLFFLALATGVMLTLAGVQESEGSETLRYLVAAAQSVIIFGYAGCTALHPSWLNVQTAGDVRAGEEGIGVAAFLLKLLLRWAPVLFGVWSVIGAVGLSVALVFLLIGGEWLPQALQFALYSWMLVLGSALVPLTFYLLMVSLSVLLDLAQSILSIPAKLDELQE